MKSLYYSYRSLFALASIFSLVVGSASWGHAMAAQIDVLIVYDPTAIDWLKAKGTNKAAFSELIVTNMNKALKNSDITDRFHLRHCMEVTKKTTKILTKYIIALADEKIRITKQFIKSVQITVPTWSP